MLSPRFPPSVNLTGTAAPALSVFTTFVVPGLSTGWRNPTKSYDSSARMNGDSDDTVPQICPVETLLLVVTSVQPPLVPPWNSRRFPGLRKALGVYAKQTVIAPVKVAVVWSS